MTCYRWLGDEEHDGMTMFMFDDNDEVAVSNSEGVVETGLWAESRMQGGGIGQVVVSDGVGGALQLIMVDCLS